MPPEMRGCAMQQGQDTILRRIGKALRADADDIVNEPLPTRWVDLIRYLDERERKRKDGREEDVATCEGRERMRRGDSP
jgi:hypothetical protein